MVSYLFTLVLMIPQAFAAPEDLARLGVSLLPDRQAQAVNEYLGTIGFEVNSGGNDQLKSTNERYLENSCFNTLAANFYSTLDADAFSNVQYLRSGFFSPEVNIGTSIEDTGFPAGYVFQLAKKITNGDANLAMMLIGLCGHDNTNTTLRLITPDAATIQSNTEKLSRSESMRAQTLRSRCRTEYRNFDHSSPAECVRELSDAAYSWSGSCPMGDSPFYQPRSLGPNADISDALRNQIVQTQSPTLGETGLNSKYYHVLGSASTACILKRGGVPKFIAQIITSKAITSYRNGRLCTLMQDYSADPSGYPSAQEIAAEIRNMLPSDLQMYRVPFVRDADMSVEMIEEKLNNAQARYDAVTLFRQSPSYQKSGNCSSVQVTDSTRQFFRSNSTLGAINPCPREWQATRCSNTRRMMATWAIDYEWSESQHRAGLDFAYDNCQETPAGSNPLASACAVTTTPSEETPTVKR